MRRVELGPTGLEVPNVILGLMRISDKSDEDIRALYDAARDSGIDFFDHADIYGPELHACERRFGEALGLSSSEREQIKIQTKAGIISSGPYYDFSYDHIISAVEGSLESLKTDWIDVLLLHRPDALVQPEEVARAFDELHSAGKVLHFGVSNQSPGYIELLKTAVKQPLVANQLQLSLTHAPLIAQQLTINMKGKDQALMLDGEILNYARINKITIQAWSPFQAGFFTGPFLGSPGYLELNQILGRLGDKYQVSPEAIAVAWITTHPAGMQVVLGSTSPARVHAAAAGSEVILERSEWYELFRAAGHLVP